MRVAFLTNILSPYRKPVFERLAQTPGWDFRLFVNAEREFDRSWEVDGSRLPVQRTASWGIKRRVVSHEPVRFEQTITLHLPYGLWGDLRRFRPDVVIASELGPRTAMAAAYCKTHGARLVIWSYQSRVSATQGRSRAAWRRWLLRRADAIVGMGKQAREVLLAWGAQEDRIVDGLNACDHESLKARLAQPTCAEQAEEIRRTWGNGRNLAIVVGRLVPLKGTEALLRGWADLPAELRDRWRLVFVGDGPLERLIHEADDPSVACAGFVAPDRIAAWYAAAELHIFPTLGDVWGLVVNEASVCGRPTLCSVHAGCSDDMIRHGENGLLYDPTQHASTVAGLTDALRRDDLPQIGQRAERTAQRFSLDNLAQSFRLAVERACPARVVATG